MRSYLEQEKEKRPNKPRLTSYGSNVSRSSIGSQDAIIINAPGAELVDSTGDKGQNSQGKSPEVQSKGSRSSQQTSSQQPHRSIGQGMHEGLLDTALIVTPPRTNDDGLPLPYDRENYPLFVSFGEGVDPFKTMFQSSYPRVSVERMKFLCARFFGTFAMGKHWIPTVLSAPHTFLSTLCCASAHLDAIFERDVESVETSSLRQEIIHLVSQNMVHPGKEVDDLNITALIQLIVSEVIGREELSLKINESGLETMIYLRGGLNQLGMSGYLASTISWVLLESSILREESPGPIYLDYCASRSTKRYAITATIPESPIYRPRSQFETLKRSRYYKKEILELLEDVHGMIELFLHPTKTSRRDSRSLLNFYRDITTKYPPLSMLQNPAQGDYKYEAIRIAAILQATAIMERIPLSKALPHAAATLLSAPATLYTFAGASRPMESPTSPLSPMDLRHDSLTSPGTVSSYASSLTSQPSSPYFDTTRSSVSSATPSRPSVSSTISHPSVTSIVTSRSSVSSSTVSLASSRQPLLAPIASPSDSNPFAEWTPVQKNDSSSMLLLNLKAALDASNMSECWRDMAGVLLWIGLTVGAASHKNGNRVLEKWYSALSMRASILLCFEHPEAVHSTMLKMGQIVEALSEPDSPRKANAMSCTTKKDSETPGKRRRAAK